MQSSYVDFNIHSRKLFFTLYFDSGNLGLPKWIRWERISLPCRRPKFNPWVWKTPWRREWLPTLEFLPGEVHGQRSLIGRSP